MVRLALACYPAWWKGRYRDEVQVVVADLVAGGRHPSRIAASLVAGATGARVRGTGLPAVAAVHCRRTRASLAVATLSVLVLYPLAVVVTLITNGSWRWVRGVVVTTATTREVVPGISLSPSPLAIAAVLVLDLCLLASLTVVLASWRAVRQARRGPLWRLLWWSPWLAPLVVGSVIFVPGLLGGGQATGGEGPGAAGGMVVGRVAMVVALATVATLVVTLVVLASRSELPLGTLQLGVGIGRLQAALAVVGAAATTAWVIGMSIPRAVETGWLHGHPASAHVIYDADPVGTFLTPGCVVVALALLAAALCTVVASCQATRSLRVAERLVLARP